MADRYLLESGSPDGYLLEDASGVLLLDITPVNWNPADKYANVTLSNSNKTATGLGGVGAAQCCRANASNTSGKWYFEVHYDTAPSSIAIGLDNGSTGVSSFTMPGQHDSNGICYHADSSSGNIFFQNNAGSPPSVSGLAAGDVVGVAVDAGTGQVWFAKNNTWTSGDPGLGTGGYASGISTFFPYIGPFNADAGTGRWAAADQTYAVPTGFAAFDSSASADVTVALTGQSISAAAGTLTPTVSFALAGKSVSAAQGQVLQGAPLVGQSVTAARGSPTASVTVALVGQSLSAAAGTVTAAAAFALAGQPVSIAQGSVAPALSAALAGQTVTVSRGSLLATTSLPLSGQALTLAQGTVTAGTSDVTVALTGHSITASQGSLAPAISPALVGQGTVSQLGSITPALSFPLAGNGIVTGTGTVAPTFDATLAGQSLIAAQGSALPSSILGLLGSGAVVSRGNIVPASNDVTVALTGVATFIAQGSVTPQFIASLVGVSLSAAPGLIGAGLHLQYPLAGIPQHRPNEAVNEDYPLTAAQTRPLTATQHYPNEGVRQRYPLEAA